MPARLLAALLVACVAAPACYAWPHCLLDPVTTYTNGVPLPQSDPYRSHNIYWQCDPYHRGCCGNHYNCPCVAFGLLPNRCGCDRPTYLPSRECNHRVESYEAMESEGVAVLGTLPAPATGLVGGAAPRR